VSPPTGSGPDAVVLLHGVGVGAAAFDAVAATLARTGTVVVPDRRGYGTRADAGPAPSLDAQVDELATVVAGAGERPAVVGVSGGATLALALALRAAATGGLDGLGPVVVHEPLVGPLAPRLHTAVTDTYTRTVAADPRLATTYVAGLVGPATWAVLPTAEREAMAGRTATIAAEIPHFLGFAPTADALAALRGHPLWSSVGARSPGARREVHELLRRRAGATALEVPGAAHLPQVDAPDAFAAALQQVLAGSHLAGTP
jgi:pimeloyl-ACP methyl ester carboxylesterase